MTAPTSVAFGCSRIAVRLAGPSSGPAVLMVHGIASDGSTWSPVQQELARLGVRSVAVDLLGHGASDKPAVGYTLEQFSASISAVCEQLELRHVTLAGHSFGGALAMYHAHHHPQLVTGLVLISSGGLGGRLHPVLRVLGMPGSEAICRLVVNPTTFAVYAQPRLHRMISLEPERIANLSRIGRNVGPAAGRAAFFSTLRHIISTNGEFGSMIEVDYLDKSRPTLIVWSERDPIVPVSDAHDLHAHLAASTLKLFAGSTHEPHRRFAVECAALVAELHNGSPANPANPANSANPANPGE